MYRVRDRVVQLLTDAVELLYFTVVSAVFALPVPYGCRVSAPLRLSKKIGLVPSNASLLSAYAHTFQEIHRAGNDYIASPSAN